MSSDFIKKYQYVIILSVLILFTIINYTINLKNNSKIINYKILSARQVYKYFKNKNCVLIDARSRPLFKIGHIKGALNLPYAERYLNKDLLQELRKKIF